jgi:hypothetical protein
MQLVSTVQEKKAVGDSELCGPNTETAVGEGEDRPFFGELAASWDTLRGFFNL